MRKTKFISKIDGVVYRLAFAKSKKNLTGSKIFKTAAFRSARLKINRALERVITTKEPATCLITRLPPRSGRKSSQRLT